MHEFTIAVESIDSSGAQSVFHAAVDELARRYGPGADDQRSMVDELREPEGFFLVARAAAHLAGGVGVRPIADPRQRIGEIKRLWVRPDLRRQGLAEALMASALHEAQTRGFLEIYLETGDRQPEAHALYQKMGWTPVEAFPAPALSHPSAFLFMTHL
ncbi:MAG TPA: GNAT family N-acetyltransferase [Acidimicrobiales bacterium]|nr:GNAT family N-acetyltransferase [Acidimicrobiales bacterium]